MNDLEPFASVGIALAAGLLVGLEREQSQDPEDRDGRRFLGGIRTFPLFALLGALTVMLERPWLVLMAFAAVAALTTVAYSDDVRRGHDRGLTTEAAVLVTFLLGALAASPDIIAPLSRRAIAVSGLSVVLTLLLSSKPRLHSLAERVSKEDLYATIKFLLVAVIVLPLLPNETIGPLEVINPFNIGLMVVLIAGIGFVGYVAIRLLGTGRGLAVTALVGGLVSSTAVTLSFAGRARKDPQTSPMAAAAILMASAIMFARVLVEVAVVHPPLVAQLALPLVAGVVSSMTLAYLLYRRRRTAPADPPAGVPLTNPFDLGTALRFGLAFAVVLFVSRAAQEYAGATGVYAAAALAGTTDVDALTLSNANLARAGMSGRVAVTAILIGAVSNTLVKAGLAWGLGGRRLGRLAALSFGVVIACTAAAGVSVWVGT